MAEDRKTPDMRATMTDIERVRHSAAQCWRRPFSGFGWRRNLPPVFLFVSK
jgi:hypothetical protein